jgi:hypothetical protein
MKRIRLIHWNKEEAAQRVKFIDAAEFEVEYRFPEGSEGIRQLVNERFAGYVIDLSRLPAQGRDLGILLRKSRTSRYTPIIFVDGDREKIKAIQKLLPDAVFTNWESINLSIRQALKNGIENPLVPRSVFAGYAGKPLVQKLGIKSGMKVSTIQAPAEFIRTLGELPEGAIIRKTTAAASELILWFVRSKKELNSKITKVSRRRDYNALWVIWPKKSGKIKTDLTQQAVRQIGLASNLVDYKICAVDETWSGLLFARRKGGKNE